MKIILVLLALCCAPLQASVAPPLAREVFVVSVKPSDPNHFIIEWNIKPGFYLYRDKISIGSQLQDILHIGDLRLPKAMSITDKRGQSYAVYQQKVEIYVPVLGIHPGEALVSLRYQGCAHDGFCYPPQRADIKITLDTNLGIKNVSLEDPVHTSKPVRQEKVLPEITLEEKMAHESWFFVMLTFLGLGLLLSFTPCVLPMVPVLSGMIVGHGSDLTTRKAFFLSLSYVLSMAMTYAVVGALVAMAGANLQVMMQSPVMIILFSLVFVLLSLSMFGFYDLKLPLSWQAALAGVSRAHAGGHYLGAAIMGCLSTLILSPCVTAPMIGALSYIAQTGAVFEGALSLFFMGLGMGLPLLLIGTSAGKLLPKAGSWMNIIKSLFGVMLLGVAIYLLDRVLPSPFSMLLWAALLIFTGVFMGALGRHEASEDRLGQGFGIMALVYGILILTGASMGSSNPLMPLQPLTLQASAETLPRPVIHSLQGLAAVKKQFAGKIIMLDFYADWCASCKAMEQGTFLDKALLALSDKVVLVKADITAQDEGEQQLMKAFSVVAPPTIIFIDQKGNEQPDLTLVGEVSAGQLIKQLQTMID